MDRLNTMLAVIEHMISILKYGKREISTENTTAEDQKEALRLWSDRWIRLPNSIYYSITNLL
ncbi:hypothetical protein KGM_203944 [Danaus plexippus plexippus]|uniref:Uncharacterized protein n=1 Tax=Danaus plexippus plexippus TaxID=278856 RepID=A0A212EP03_DANPL|nr:hypothetical protein KGM_203944 [Danaus plexippus plexippus]